MLTRRSFPRCSGAQAQAAAERPKACASQDTELPNLDAAHIPQHGGPTPGGAKFSAQHITLTLAVDLTCLICTCYQAAVMLAAQLGRGCTSVKSAMIARALSSAWGMMQDPIASALVRSLQTCPDIVSLRKELLVATRHVLSTPLKAGALQALHCTENAQHWDTCAS
jgi:hypothetical protein